jgi:hypothetical protein
MALPYFIQTRRVRPKFGALLLSSSPLIREINPLLSLGGGVEACCKLHDDGPLKEVLSYKPLFGRCDGRLKGISNSGAASTGRDCR